jgi:subtilisin family serine protease
MATPHVAAAAAFVRAKHPDWAPAEVKEHLVKTARKLADMKTKAFTQALGNGLLDLKRALS